MKCQTTKLPLRRCHSAAPPPPLPHPTPVLQGRVATLQALSGTGSLRCGAAFIAKFLPGTTVYISNPTWGNHKNIFNDAGVGAAFCAALFLMQVRP